MANIIKLKIQDSDLGHNVCVWLDTGDVEMFPVDTATQPYVEQFKAGELEPSELLDKFRASIDQTLAVAEAEKAVTVRLEKVSERLSCDGMHVYFDGAAFEKIQLDSALEKHLIRLMTERNQSAAAMRDWRSYAAFAENLYSNVDERIRSQFVKWLEAQEWLTFTEDGCFIGYKGCQKNEKTGIAESIKCGPGIVNGAVYNGHIPNPDGAIVEIDRSLVENDPSVGCASGMHVGTYDYAKGWGNGILLRVKVNPRDVISVPFDCSAQKIRTCRYTVLDHEEYERGQDVDYDRGAMTWGDDNEYDWEELEEWCEDFFEFDPDECLENCGVDCLLCGCDDDDGYFVCPECVNYDDNYDYQFQSFCEAHRQEFEDWRDDNDACAPHHLNVVGNNGGCDCGGTGGSTNLNGAAGDVRQGSVTNETVSNDVDVLGSLADTLSTAMGDAPDVKATVAATSDATDDVDGLPVVDDGEVTIVMDVPAAEFDSDVDVIADLERALGIE